MRLEPCFRMLRGVLYSSRFRVQAEAIFSKRSWFEKTFQKCSVTSQQSRSTSSSTMPTALVFLAEGAEEMEAVITIDVLRRGGVDVKVVGVTGPDPVTCSRQVKIVPDVGIDAVKDQPPVDAAIVPGGLKGAEACANDPAVGKILKAHEEAGKVVAAICAGPTALQSHSIGLGKKITSYPSFKDKLCGNYTYLEDNVVVDGNIVTSRGPGTAFDFALALVEKLCGKEKADATAAPMLVGK